MFTDYGFYSSPADPSKGVPTLLESLDPFMEVYRIELAKFDVLFTVIWPSSTS